MTSIFFDSPPLSTVTFTLSPTTFESRILNKSDESITVFPSISLMISPIDILPFADWVVAFNPAFCAPPPGTVLSINTPVVLRRLVTKESGAMLIPSPGLMTLPNSISCGTMRLTVSTGTAKPIPA